MRDKIPIIYLIGSGHCGSTLLDMIMSSHSKIIGVGELHSFSTKKENLEKLICTCKKSAFECPFWKCTRKNLSFPEGLAVYRKKIDFLLNRKNYVFNNKERKKIDLKEYIKFNEKIYENILNCSGKEIVFDSSKETNRAEILLLSEKLDITFLHLVRDGRGVMHSYKRKYGKRFSSIWRWLGLNLKCEIIKKRNKVKIIFSRYEDLVKEPEKELTKILNQLGLSFEPEMLKFKKTEHHQIAGNRLRFDNSNEIKEDLSWKENLSFFDLFLFNIFSGWLNKIYGY